MANGLRKERRMKQRLMNRTPSERYEWLVTLMGGTDCILRIEDKYRIYRRLDSEFTDLSQLSEEDAGDFTDQEKCAEYAEQCRQIADAMEKDLPEETEKYSRTEMMSAERRQEENKKSEGSHSVFRWVLICAFVLVVALLICRKIPTTRAVIGEVEHFLGFNNFAIKSFRVAGDTSDGWKKAVQTEQDVLSDASVGKKVKFGKLDWIVLDHKEGRTLLIAYDAIKNRAYHNQSGTVTWSGSHIRKYLNNKFIDKNFYPYEKEAIADTMVCDPDDPTADLVTYDKVFLPTEDDIMNFEDVLENRINNLRLRDRGENEGTTSFVSAEGDLVESGYPADMSGCLIRPMIWVNS